MALTIFLILATLTIGAFQNDSIDRVSGATGLVKAAIDGARSRAIKDKQIRGVRLVVDQNNTRWCTSLLYVGANNTDEGNVADGRTVNVTSPTLVEPSSALQAEWVAMMNRGILSADRGLRIQIPKDTGMWYPVTGVDDTTGRIAIGIPFAYGTGSNLDYRLELGAAPLEGTDPVVLPQGAVIDLDGCKLPANWRLSGGPPNYSSTMDIMFTPRGTVVGDVLVEGIIHLYIADVVDATLNTGLSGRPTSASASNGIIPADPARDHRLVTLFAQTGQLTTAPVFVGNGDTNGTFNDEVAGSPYDYAIRGEEAN